MYGKKCSEPPNPSLTIDARGAWLLQVVQLLVLPVVVMGVLAFPVVQVGALVSFLPWLVAYHLQGWGLLQEVGKQEVACEGLTAEILALASQTQLAL